MHYKNTFGYKYLYYRDADSSQFIVFETYNFLKMMKLIADSGSTKTDWLLMDGGKELKSIATLGLNPIILGKEGMEEILKKELLPEIPDVSTVEEIDFYGAGCTPEQIPVVGELLGELFPSTKHVSVESDLMGAARALCGRNRGVACILGTGSNSCLYDGDVIIQNTPALGYILGDEGSGSVLGKMFLNAILKGSLPMDIRDEFLEEYNLTLPIIINKVYRQPMANRFLASISPFIGKCIENQQIRCMVIDNFRNFIRINLTPYFKNAKTIEWGGNLEVNFVGSIAHYYKSELLEAASLEGIKVGLVVKSPIGRLKIFHS